MNFQKFLTPEVIHPFYIILVGMTKREFIKNHIQEFHLSFFLEHDSLISITLDQIIPDESWYWDISESQPFYSSFKMWIWFIWNIILIIFRLS
jgi:hypothetical protein